jgi:hypothetical protein
MLSQDSPTAENDQFEQLYTITTDFDPPIVVHNKMVSPTRNLGIIPGHPLNPSPQETIFIPKCCLVFEGVKKIGLRTLVLCCRTP